MMDHGLTCQGHFTIYFVCLITTLSLGLISTICVLHFLSVYALLLNFLLSCFFMHNFVLWSHSSLYIFDGWYAILTLLPSKIFYRDLQVEYWGVAIYSLKKDSQDSAHFFPSVIIVWVFLAKLEIIFSHIPFNFGCSGVDRYILAPISLTYFVHSHEL